MKNKNDCRRYPESGLFPLTLTAGAALLCAAALVVLPVSPRAATPLDDVHPAWTLHDLRPAAGFQPMVGGMAFMSDGRLVVGDWNGTRPACCPGGGTNFGGRQFTGRVYILSGVTGNSPGVSVQTFATELEDIMGVAVVRDTIYVSGGNNIVRLVDVDSDGTADRTDTIFTLPGTPQTSGPNAGDSLHPVKGRSEWMYGMLARNDTFFVNPSSMYSGSTNQVNPFRGRHLAVTPGDGILDKRGSFQTLSTGFRHHTGLTFGPEGSRWTVETQGHWVPSNKLIHLKDGAHYGYRHSGAGADPTWPDLPETPAAVFMPQEGGGGNGNMNAGGVFSNSPGQPLYLTSGPYAGQFLMGDVSWGGVQRFFVEQVEGEYQGAGFVWMGGLEAGVYRMAQGPDGHIYFGMLGTSGDWSWNGQFYGLQKASYNGTPAFEMLAVRSRTQGMEIEFTLPVDTAAAKNPANYEVSTYYYQPTPGYGGTKQGGATPLTPGAIQVSGDRKRVYLPLSGLQARTGNQHRIVEIELENGLTSATGATSWNRNAYYTLNAISTSQPFEPTSIDRGIATKRLDGRLGWTIRGDRLEVRVPFGGSYTLRLTDVRGKVLARASGRGAGEHGLAFGDGGGQVAVLEARGDGVRLRRTLLLP